QTAEQARIGLDDKLDLATDTLRQGLQQSLFLRLIEGRGGRDFGPHLTASTRKLRQEGPDHAWKRKETAVLSHYQDEPPGKISNPGPGQDRIHGLRLLLASVKRTT